MKPRPLESFWKSVPGLKRVLILDLENLRNFHKDMSILSMKKIGHFFLQI